MSCTALRIGVGITVSSNGEGFIKGGMSDSPTPAAAMRQIARDGTKLMLVRLDGCMIGIDPKAVGLPCSPWR